MPNKLALFVTHNIFLTNNQIEDLLSKNFIKIVGVSVPVWINPKNAKTTEPALEIFCKYEFEKTKEEFADITFINEGYKIFLPTPKWKPPKLINFEELSNLSEKERANYEKKREKWWRENEEPMSIDSLKTSKYFRMQIKKLDQIFDKIDNCLVDVQHTIQIKTIESLEKSLV
jgi:hypothetical protein